jgi:hypothetical protein
VNDLPFIPVPKADLKDPEYYKWATDKVRDMRAKCFVTGLRTPLVVHHVRGRKMGEKNNLVIVWSWLHTELADSYHKLGSYQRFDEVHNCDSVGEAIRLYQEYLKITKETDNNP